MPVTTASSGQRRTALIVAAGLTLGGLTALVAFRNLPQDALPASHQGLDSLTTGDSPIGPGAESASGSPTTAMPFPVLLPASNDQSTEITTSWTRATFEPAVALELRTGTLIMERPAEAIDFPTDEYYRQLGDGLEGATILDINGASALAIQSTLDLGNPSSVDVILSGVHVSIIGAIGQDVSELVELARSLPATGAGQPLKL